jgi:branched-subunit amino acid transport protein
MTAVVAMLALGVICFGFRTLFIVVLPAERLPAGMRASLTHLVPAVLAALVAVEVNATTTGAEPAIVVIVLGCVGLVALAAWRTGSMLFAISLSLAAALVLDLWMQV